MGATSVDARPRRMGALERLPTGLVAGGIVPRLRACDAMALAATSRRMRDEVAGAVLPITLAADARACPERPSERLERNLAAIERGVVAGVAAVRARATPAGAEVLRRLALARSPPAAVEISGRARDVGATLLAFAGAGAGLRELTLRCEGGEAGLPLADLVAAFPNLRALCVENVHPDDLAAPVRGWAALEGLVARNDRDPFGFAGRLRTAALPHPLPGLRRLTLEHPTEFLCVRLPEAFPGLRELDLTLMADTVPEARAILAGALRLPRLEALVFSNGSPIHDGFANRLALEEAIRGAPALASITFAIGSGLELSEETAALLARLERPLELDRVVVRPNRRFPAEAMGRVRGLSFDRIAFAERDAYVELQDYAPDGLGPFARWLSRSGARGRAYREVDVGFGWRYRRWYGIDGDDVLALARALGPRVARYRRHLSIPARLAPVEIALLSDHGHKDVAYALDGDPEEDAAALAEACRLAGFDAAWKTGEFHLHGSGRDDVLRAVARSHPQYRRFLH